MLIRLFSYVICILFVLLESCSPGPEIISIMITPESSQRVLFGIENLEEALKETGFEAVVIKKNEFPDDRPLILLGNPENNTAIQTLMKSSLLKIEGEKPEKEGFTIYNCKGKGRYVGHALPVQP